jgi:hypothetical protein
MAMGRTLAAATAGLAGSPGSLIAGGARCLSAKDPSLSSFFLDSLFARFCFKKKYSFYFCILLSTKKP